MSAAETLIVRVHWTWKSEDDSNWRASKELDQWWSLAGVGTHCLDLARLVLASVSEKSEVILAIASNKIWNGPHDELAILAIRFTNRSTAEICSYAIFSRPSSFEIYGRAGYTIA